jgi:hypothetical protein
MRIHVACVLSVGIAAGMLCHGDRSALRATQAPTGRAAVVDRFLADIGSPLVRYCAIRRLSAAARGGKMTATMTARTWLSPEEGFRYEVLDEGGSTLLRSRVLRGVLEAESDAKRRDQGSHGSLTEANYEFTTTDAMPDGHLRVGIRPKRKDTLLIDGTILLTAESADLVRIEGTLVKRPSFWTRRVQVVRNYGRIGGVRVPLMTSSIADVLFAGQSTFTMAYEYESINGQPIAASESLTAAARR